MISAFIYLYAFVLSYLGIMLDILIPFPVPDLLNSTLDIFSSFWYYGLSFIPITTITFGKALFYSLSFIIALKIFDLMRLPFSWLESNFTSSIQPPSVKVSSHTFSAKDSPRRRLLNDYHAPIRNKK